MTPATHLRDLLTAQPAAAARSPVGGGSTQSRARRVIRASSLLELGRAVHAARFFSPLSALRPLDAMPSAAPIHDWNGPGLLTLRHSQTVTAALTLNRHRNSRQRGGEVLWRRQATESGPSRCAPSRGTKRPGTASSLAGPAPVAVDAAPQWRGEGEMPTATGTIEAPQMRTASDPSRMVRETRPEGAVGDVLIARPPVSGGDFVGMSNWPGLRASAPFSGVAA